HADLHSFPTRRSSDLSAAHSRAAGFGMGVSTAPKRPTTCTATCAKARAAAGSWWTTPPADPITRGWNDCHATVVRAPATTTNPRSEEHTSELQSLAYL